MKLVRVKGGPAGYPTRGMVGQLFILPDELPDGYVEAGIYKWAKSVATGEYYVFMPDEYEEASDEAG